VVAYEHGGEGGAEAAAAGVDVGHFAFGPLGSTVSISRSGPIGCRFSGVIDVVLGEEGLMRYMLLINIDKTAPPPQKAEMEAILRGHECFEAELRAAGNKMVHPERMHPDGASRVRLKDGRPLVTDGPFAETKEVIGGFYVIECDTKDEAIEWAKKIPLRADRAVEVRPVWPK
jgi:hypothetical protein